MKLHCYFCRKVCLEISPDNERPYRYKMGAKMVCPDCLERVKIADDIAKMAHEQTEHEMPDFMKEVFNVNRR